ncbi:MAG: hypothetical protein AB1742_15460 [bacterium]
MEPETNAIEKHLNDRGWRFLLVLSMCCAAYALALHALQARWYGGGAAGAPIAAGALANWGMRLYRDVWFGAPPGTVWVSALALAVKTSVWSVFALEWACAAACCLLIHRIARGWNSAASSAGGAALFLAFSAWSMGMGTLGEKFHVLLFLCALHVLYARRENAVRPGAPPAPRAERLMRVFPWVLPGVAAFFGLSAVPVSLFLLAYLKPWKNGKGNPLAPAFLVMLPAALFSVALLAVGDFGDFFDQVFRFGYYDYRARLSDNLYSFVEDYETFLISAPLWGLAAAYGLKSGGTRASIFRAWLLAEVVRMAVFEGFSPGAVLRCAGPLAVLSAGAIENLSAAQGGRAANRAALAFITVLFAVSLGRMSVVLWTDPDYYRGGAVIPWWRDAAADAVRRTSGENDRIYVWGDESILYLYARRLPATKFITPQPFTTPGYMSQKQLRDFADTFDTAPPFLVVSDSMFPEIDAAPPETPAAAALGIVRDAVREKYRLLSATGRLLVCMRRNGAGTPEPEDAGR